MQLVSAIQAGLSGLLYEKEIDRKLLLFFFFEMCLKKRAGSNVF